MKILLVSNQAKNKDGVGNPIMYRMRDALNQDKRVEKVDFYPVVNSLGCFISLRKLASDYDIVHIHFGGLYALLLRLMLVGLRVRKFITFHGTDIHAKAIRTTKSLREKIKIRLNQRASFLSLLLFERCGFVAADMMKYVPACFNGILNKRSFVQGLGVDYEKFRPCSKDEAQQYLRLDKGKYVLFSDVSNTPIKRRDIARSIVKELGDNYNLLVMCGVKPEDVPYYINACDFAVLTSDEEGSPNIIREVLSVNKPIFSVDVGDASSQLKGLNNSCIISRNPAYAASTIRDYISKPYTDNTRQSLRSLLDFVKVNAKVVDLYADNLKRI